MQSNQRSIPFVAMVSFITVAVAAACVASYFYMFQTGMGETGLHNQFIAEIASIVAFAAGILACAFANPYQKKKKATGAEEEVSPMVLALIAIGCAVMIAILAFAVSNNVADQKNGSVVADDMTFVNKTHVGSFIAKKAAAAAVAPRTRIVFSDADGNLLSFSLANHDYAQLSEKIDLNSEREYEISYYPNSNTLVSIS